MLALVLLWIVVYLSGRLFCKIGGEKEASQWWIHLTGFFFLFLSQGIVFFSGQLLLKNFSECRKLLELIYLGFSLLAAAICHKEVIGDIKKLKNRKKENNPYKRHILLLIWLLAGLFWVILTGWDGSRADAVVETAGVTLLTDTMNQYHPFTHQPYWLGVIFSRKIITLPFWYAALSHWTGFPPAFCVRAIGSLLSLIFSLLVVTELGSLLFERNLHHTCWLVIFMELLYLSGDYHIGSQAYQQFYYGYSGQVMITTVIVPYMIIVLYRLLGHTLRQNFNREKYGIHLWSSLMRLLIAFSVSLFLVSLKWALMMILCSMGVFVLMTFTIATMKKMVAKREEA